jgi:hypothetical protein
VTISKLERWIPLWDYRERQNRLRKRIDENRIGCHLSDVAKEEEEFYEFPFQVTKPNEVKKGFAFYF